jgi:hypothetical protein
MLPLGLHQPAWAMPGGHTVPSPTWFVSRSLKDLRRCSPCRIMSQVVGSLDLSYCRDMWQPRQGSGRGLVHMLGVDSLYACRTNTRVPAPDDAGRLGC